ncbi:GNAT family N-acetyltransferase [Streptomyces sp. WMMC897]|uniref:GNAT family N-acetyltransferase n=1 Tax=Streptomyces sp. WMMC897 TaxID=3014782 RepID=UPI0022B70873|nr:GNAT family N-acetyltransferase [Streptomyces sp. WMMC897]MCZ7414861.1 GNAT family N-acetyltransferase [Streptomyces sp. WMMC897]
MTVERHELTLRPIAGREELDLFNQLPYTLNTGIAHDLTQGRRRPGWLWIAERGGQLLARLGWWNRPGNDTPFLLDILDVDDTLPGPERVAVGTKLLRTAMAATLPTGATPPEYTRFVPPGWQDDPAARRTVQDRMAVVADTGGRLFVERIRLEWLPDAPPPAPRGRLNFRQLRDTEELLTLMTSALEGTLDAHSREDLTRMSARAAAVSHYEDELARYDSPRDWWRVATLPDGTPVGFVLPAHNGYNPIIAYLAVLPEHRGDGYIDDVLAEGTRVLAGQGVPRVRASTDLGNTPMAKAFQRAGYAAFEHELNMTWR